MGKPLTRQSYRGHMECGSLLPLYIRQLAAVVTPRTSRMNAPRKGSHVRLTLLKRAGAKTSSFGAN